MTLTFGREICGDLAVAQQREWLVTNGIGGYASGTVAGLATRGYHGWLVAALQPPLGRTVLVSHGDETVTLGDRTFALATHRWTDGTVSPQGFRYLEQFQLEGTLPRWTYALDEARLEKQIWMEREANTTYVQYHHGRGQEPLTLSLQAFVNYRDYHSRTRGAGWQMAIQPTDQGVCVTAFEGATPFFINADRGSFALAHTWYRNVELAAERDRGLQSYEDILHAATLTATLLPGETLTLVASTHPTPSLDGAAALQRYRDHETHLQEQWPMARLQTASQAPDWIYQLVLAADQFIVNRPLPDHTQGKTIIAGYPWFADWGRDTMISLPGLTLTTGRADIARAILSTFAHYVSRGMVPNRFPDQNSPLTDADYNTVDATLWYVEAVRQYLTATGDDSLLLQLFPVLEEIIDRHIQGTRYNIRLDSNDGLLYAGEQGVQLTWMDAKIGDWVITPRIGKPVEINALWYCALQTMAQFCGYLGKPSDFYHCMAQATLKGFTRFWSADRGYCFDVLDTPTGNDDALRPNQLLAISVPAGYGTIPPLLSLGQQQQVVRACERTLLTSYGLRSLAPTHADYQGHYSGDPTHRDQVYHQGTVWGWLLGPFALAHHAAFQDAAAARQYLQPIAHHLHTAGLGSFSEIFDGNAPHLPQGCTAQAWSVAEVLRTWQVLEDKSPT